MLLAPPTAGGAYGYGLSRFNPPSDGVGSNGGVGG